MNKATLLLMTIILFCSSIKAQNILTNPSFESGGWTPTITGPSAATFSIITTDTVWGANSLTANVTAYSGTVTSIKYESPTAAASPSTNYVISFWAKAAIDGRTMDVEANYIGGTDTKRQINLTPEWRYYQYNVISPAGTTAMGINFYLKGTGNFFSTSVALQRSQIGLTIWITGSISAAKVILQSVYKSPMLPPM